jgi:ribosomal protein L14
MIQKSTIVALADKSGALTANVFHIYNGARKKIAKIGNFVKVSIRQLDVNARVKKKNKFISIFIKSTFRYTKLDGSTIYSDTNTVVLLKKRLTPVGKEIYGPVYKLVNRKKFINSFPGII